MQEQASDFFFCFFSLSQLSEPGRLGTALSGPAGRRASAMTFSRCDTSLTVDCCSFSICRTQSPEELGRVGERSLRSGWTARLSCGDTDFFFFFLMLTRRRGLGERGDKILRWRHSNCTHYDACRRETAWVFLASNPGPHHFDPSARPSWRGGLFTKVEHSDRSDEGLGSRLECSQRR